MSAADAPPGVDTKQAQLELVEPGLVPFAEWWPAGPDIDPPPSPDLFVGGVAETMNRSSA